MAEIGKRRTGEGAGQRRGIKAKTVVIADDEPIVRMDLKDMLTGLGFDVTGEAGDGFSAVEICRSKKPDIVFMDVKMPVFDGLYATETITAEELAGCVILLTAFSDTEMIERAAKSGVNGYLVKPVYEKNILPAVEVAFAQSVRLRETARELKKAQEREHSRRIIFKAQRIVADRDGCTEEEAYHRIRGIAMDSRLSIEEIAGRVIAENEKISEVDWVKKYLREHRGLTENKAYRYITEFGASHGLSVEEAARKMRRYVEAQDETQHCKAERNL